jgi:hypothetical protein
LVNIFNRAALDGEKGGFESPLSHH